MKVEQEGLPETGTFRLISKRKVEVGQIMGVGRSGRRGSVSEFPGTAVISFYLLSCNSAPSKSRSCPY